ncbi:MAG TPA: hypothetical protein VF618_09410 [Thermoanaerobaculia bacterium]
MSANENVVSAVAVEVEPVVTSYTEGALARLEELRAMRGSIPRFTIPPTPRETSRLSAVASVPPDFVELAAVMAVANPEAVTRIQAVSPAGMRDLLAYATAYAPLVEELEALTKFVRFTVLTARNEACGEALAIYATAKRLVKQPKYADLAPHVAAMRRVLGKVPSAESRERRAAKKAAAQKAATQQAA